MQTKINVYKIHLVKKISSKITKLTHLRSNYLFLIFIKLPH